MKSLYLILLSLLISATSFAADKYTTATVSAATPLTVLTGGKYTIKDILFTGATNGTAKFYDSASNTTNVVRAAYTSYSVVSTNWSTIFTNSAGILVTNTFTGVATLPTSNLASTNERPSILGPFLVSTTARAINDLKLKPALGFTIYSTAAGTVEVVYEQDEQ